MEYMEYRPLKITLISARDLKDLKDVHLVSKMEVYAVININVDPRTKLKTPVDRDCGCNPKWNYTIKLIMEEAAANQNRLNLVIRLVSDGLVGFKDIGEVKVPIKELLDCKEKVFVYNVRLPNGKEKGTLNLCCKIGEKFSVPVAATPHVTERGTSAKTPVMAYPAAGSRAGYPPQPPPAYPYNCPPQGAYTPPPPHGAYPPPPTHGAYPPPPPHGCYPPPPPAAYPYNSPPQGAYPSQPPHGCYPPPPPAAYPYNSPPQGAYPPSPPHGCYRPPPPAVYPYNSPPQGAYPPPPPHGRYPPPPAQGYEYTGPLPYANGYMPAQQPAAGLGQAPAGTLFGSLLMVGMLSDIFANFTGALDALFDF